jgi:hypothetical protein
LIYAQDPTISLELRGDQTCFFLSYVRACRPWITAKDEGIRFDHFQPSIYMFLTVLQGCLDLTTQADGGRMVRETPFGEFVERCTIRWPTYTSYWEEMFGSSTPDPIKRAVSNDETWLLRTQAQTATLRLSTHEDHNVSMSRGCGYPNGFQILSSSGKVLGVAPAAPLLDAFVTSEATDGTTQTDTDELSVAPDIKAIAISTGVVTYELQCFIPHGCKPVGHYRKRVLNEHISYQDSTGRFWDPVPVVNVMFIGEQEGHWRRLGIGRVLLRRWVELERKTETITLW